MNDDKQSPIKDLRIVVAIAENNAIGKNNQLLWHLPADLKHFKNLTTGHTIIMGRKTYDSVGRPLPNRRNIVITRQKGLKIDGVEVVNSLDEALSLCNENGVVDIVGGAEIYKQALPVTQTIYLTTVHHHFDADTFFPEIDIAEWKEIQTETHQPDEKNPYSYTFSTLQRV